MVRIGLADCRSRSGSRLAVANEREGGYEYVQPSGFEGRQILDWQKVSF
ncbi:hypothetical protein [Enterococcus sp. AZ149]